jgi:hypothetical protein
MMEAFEDLIGGHHQLEDGKHAWNLLIRIAACKAANHAREHMRLKRDMRREIPGGAEEIDDVMERGHRVSRPSQTGPRVDTADLGAGLATDSFPNENTIDLWVKERRPDIAALVVDLFEILQEHDQREEDCLQEIARLKLKGHLKHNIAKKLKLSVRTVQRKFELIAKVWEVTKTVIVSMESPADEEDQEIVTVLPTTTAANVLHRIGLVSGYALQRRQSRQPFKESDCIYGKVAEGDTLNVVTAITS